MKDLGSKVLEDNIKVEKEEKVINIATKEAERVDLNELDENEAAICKLTEGVTALNLEPKDEDLQDEKLNSDDKYVDRGPSGGKEVNRHQYFGNDVYNDSPNCNNRRGLETDRLGDPSPGPKFFRPGPSAPSFMPQHDQLTGFTFNNLDAPTGANPFASSLDSYPNQVITCNPVPGSGGTIIVQSPSANGPSVVDDFLDKIINDQNQLQPQKQRAIPDQHNNQFATNMSHLIYHQMTGMSNPEENVLSPTPSVGSVSMSSPISDRRPSDPQADSGVESAAGSPYSDIAPSPGSNYSCPPSVESGYGRSPQHEPGFGPTNYPMSPPKYPVTSPNTNRFTPSPGSTMGYYQQIQQQPQPLQQPHKDPTMDPNTIELLEDFYAVIQKDIDDDQNKKQMCNKQKMQSYPGLMSQGPMNVSQGSNKIPYPLMEKQPVPPFQHIPPQQLPFQQPKPQPGKPVQLVTTAPIIIPPTVATTSSNQPSFIIVPQPAQTTPGPLIVVTQVPKSQPEKPRKPRPILPKVPSSSTSTTPSPKNGSDTVCRTSSANKSNIMASREGQPAVKNQQQTTNAKGTGVDNKLLMIARRTVAEIKEDELLKVDEEGDTILHIAVCKTDKHLVQALLERFYRSNMMSFADHENNKRQTPLYLAVCINQAVMVAMFVRFQVNVNTLAQCFSPDGRTREVKAALHVAASQGQDLLDTLQQLLQAKDISINIVNNYGQTALHCAIAAHQRVMRKSEERINSIPVIKMLIKSGADVSAQDQKSGKTPLMYAIEQRDYSLVETILSNIDPSKVRNVVRTQAFDGSSCLKIAEGLKDSYNMQAWNKLWNCLQSAANGTMRIQPPVF